MECLQRNTDCHDTSSKHKIQCYISCKQEIPPVSWLFLSPQKPFAFAGTPFSASGGGLAMTWGTRVAAATGRREAQEPPLQRCYDTERITERQQLSCARVVSGDSPLLAMTWGGITQLWGAEKAGGRSHRLLGYAWRVTGLSVSHCAFLTQRTERLHR